MKREDVIRILRENRDALTRFKVSALSIFGSVARDEARPDSDVDILVDFSGPVGIFEFLELKEFLEQLLKRRVDLATKQALKKQLRDAILKEAIRAA